MLPREQGDQALMAASYVLSCEGYFVAYPITDNRPYDLIVERDGSLSRVQVKSTTKLSRTTRAFEVELRRKRHNTKGTKTYTYDLDSADLLYVLTQEGSSYLIPHEDITTATMLTLGSKYERFKLKTRVDVPGW